MKRQLKHRVRSQCFGSVVLLLSGSALTACSKGDSAASAAPTATEPGVPAAPVAAPAEPTPSPSPATVAGEPNAQQVPVVEDFEAQAAQQITASNLKPQLDSLENEIGK